VSSMQRRRGVLAKVWKTHVHPTTAATRSRSPTGRAVRGPVRADPAAQRQSRGPRPAADQHHPHDRGRRPRRRHAVVARGSARPGLGRRLPAGLPPRRAQDAALGDRHPREAELMAFIYKNTPKIIAQLDEGVQAEIWERTFEIAVRAEELLKQHRAEGIARSTWPRATSTPTWCSKTPTPPTPGTGANSAAFDRVRPQRVPPSWSWTTPARPSPVRGRRDGGPAHPRRRVAPAQAQERPKVQRPEGRQGQGQEEARRGARLMAGLPRRSRRSPSSPPSKT
jgi:hypothetical protein